MLLPLLHLLLLGIVLASLVYTLAAAWLVGGLGTPAATPGPLPDVTLLKPLHGAEPRLRECLSSFLAQDYAGDVQMLCGVSNPRDPAGGIARAVGAELVAGSPRVGANGKISNVLGMMPHARHDVLVLSDSDMAVPPDYLSAVIGALVSRVAPASPRRKLVSRLPSTAEGTAASPDLRGQAAGAVTCLYRGRGDAGGWSTLAAAGLSYHFLPSVLVGLAIGRAEPCMGSTIALRRDTLEAIGGFGRFADVLADDFAIGAAVRALGLAVAVPPLVLTHGCADASFGAVLRHELRWAATVRLVDPVGYVTTAVTHPLPLALVAAGILGGGAWWLAAAALAVRLLLRARIDRVVGEPSAPLWMLPLRDLLSGALFVAGLFVRRVEWRGERLGLASDGRMELGR